MIDYVIELSLIHSVLIAGYWVFLRRERAYATMRLYLIASTLFAMVIPLLKLPKLFFLDEEPVAVSFGVAPISAAPVSGVIEHQTSSYDLLIWLYILISAFFLLKLVGSMLYLVYLKRKSSCERFDDVYVHKNEITRASFTFFNWIFLSKEIDKKHYEAILKHEKAHASLGHSYDLMVFEFFKVCFWWLPSAWIINREIKTIHEYQADASVLESCDAEQYSAVLISYTLKSNGLSSVHSFHDGLILKRLNAMKLQAKQIRPWKLWALSAVGTLLFIVFACSEDPAKAQDNKEGNATQGEIFTIVEAQPEFEGGVDAFYKSIMNEVRYPLKARLQGVEGQVDVQFVVRKDGSVSDVHVINGISKECDAEAVRVIEGLPSFKPATQNGRPVNVRMAIPLVFKLNKEKTNKDGSMQGMVIVNPVQPINQKSKVDATYVDGEWTGRVLDENGEGLPGANILVAGTTTGTRSGSDGSFKIKADRNNELVVSFVGYETVRVK